MKQTLSVGFAARVGILMAMAVAGKVASSQAIDITPGLVSTYAGSLSTGGGGTVGNGGAATAANLNLPYAARFDSANNLYILDAGNNVVQGRLARSPLRERPATEATAARRRQRSWAPRRAGSM
jgi:hypothetical protein